MWPFSIGNVRTVISLFLAFFIWSAIWATLSLSLYVVFCLVFLDDNTRLLISVEPISSFEDVEISSCKTFNKSVKSKGLYCFDELKCSMYWSPTWHVQYSHKKCEWKNRNCDYFYRQQNFFTLFIFGEIRWRVTYGYVAFVNSFNFVYAWAKLNADDIL